MADYHTYYKGPEGETTQWEDIQIRLGNLAPKEKAWKPEKYAPEEELSKNKEWIDAKTQDELEEGLDEEFQDDRALNEYRLQRIQQIKAAAAKPKFGTVELIRGSEFVQKVTQASEKYLVACLLYREGHIPCRPLLQCLPELASKYPSTKFVQCFAQDAIPNYPDAGLPLLLLYKDGQCVKNLQGLKPYGGDKLTPEHLALVLNTFGPYCIRDGEDEDQATNDQIRSLATRLADKRAEYGGTKDPEDESSDFDD
uniref:Phosducin domain-containing protein n=1 Tax=Polytomella parva TaxID=51329 RepID=A0A6U0Z877_9CHLO|eukprot:CAMPEP_0175064068 /NCGR_PEP_ID=MMETSP0052_2-20121109/15116_1 /TAXON_ID=51329 ORGANISM="Polytomella parva, Strain SAG 63-3" /NCGR_SAMPLE_ID=MMETSP0052_2 /ASSEMBLY_ACC=CAM_ASM_000194 /LENGTH=253 /DNA_ID=CAMNT_0016330355 /DNA_START=35 /DNA_END=796 /DNA_ORIENTATION=-